MQFLTPITDWLVKQRISIVMALTVSMAILVMLGVSGILIFGGWDRNESDIALVESRARAEADLVAERAYAFVRPLQNQLAYLESEFRAGRIDLADIDAVATILSTAMNSVPQSNVAGFSLYRGTTILMSRNAEEDLATELEPGVFGAEIWNLDADESGVVLAPVLHDEATGKTLLPFVRRLQIDGENRLHIIVAAEVSSFSEWMTNALTPLGARTFGLYGPDRVLAHRRSKSLIPDEDQAKRSPLPHVSATEDAILLALWRDETTPAPLSGTNGDVNANTANRYLFRMGVLESGPVLIPIVELGGLSSEPWLLGTSFAFDSAELSAVGSGSTWVASAVMLGLFGLIFLLARYITQPVEGLAETARQVSRLQLDNIPQIPPSIFREFNDAADAFKTMSVGLDWFQSYVPSTLVRKLLRQADDGELQPETKSLTIMFTDVVGFTRLSEQMEAQDIVDMLNDHFSLIGQCIDQEAGTIDKYIGDGLMAFWGAPDQQPDHAIRAVDAAEAIGGALRDKNETRRDLGLEPIAVRIGIFTGRVSIGNIGAPGRINYTVIGDAVNAAQRLERLGASIMTEDEEAIILVSEETITSIERNASDLNKQVAKDRFTFIGEHTLEGRMEPTRVYRIEA